MSETNDGSGAGMLAFLDWAGSRGEIAPNTAKSIAVSAGKVLAVEADPKEVDVVRLDEEDLFARFETLNRMNYTTQSMGTYRSRFMRAISMYRAWLEKRPDWKTAGLRPPSKAVAVRATNGKPPSKARVKTTPQKPTSASSTDEADLPAAPSNLPMIPYDLPLRPGLRVRLVLPEMLTQADAKRIAAFVNSLAFDQAQPSKEGM
jgi:hypothetical protein